MTDKDRIRLAEAMHKCVGGCDDESYTVGCPVHDFMVFQPFTDANDDYAVLEWMREQNNKPWQYHLSQLNNGKGRYKWDYRIGDYARAALKVLDDD